jgi:hypothetical protein
MPASRTPAPAGQAHGEQGTATPNAAGAPPPGEAGPGAPGSQTAGPASDPMTGPAAPASQSMRRSQSSIQLVVAGATVSSIAAVAGWLVLGGRRRERAPVAVSESSGMTLTLAPTMKLDLDVVRSDPGGARQGRYAGRVLAWSATTLWRAEDDRPRWIRRLDEQVPSRVPVRHASLGPEDEPMPWLAAMAWSAGDESDRD